MERVMELKISCKSVSKRRNTIKSVLYQYENPIHTVKDLLTETVRLNVAEYDKRQESSEILNVLSNDDIEDMATTGKVGFGVNYGNKKPDVDKAIQNALECFQDGLVVVFIEGNQFTKEDEPLSLKDGDEITFVRMTMLSGRMW